MDIAALRPRVTTVRRFARPAKASDFGAMIHLSQGTGVFTAGELASLRTDFETCEDAAGDRLIVCHSESGGLWGFIQYSPAPITIGSWYVYWIVVDLIAQGQGVGALLLNYAEADLKALGARQILIETSSKPLYADARRFYLGRGYAEVARLADYYADGDDKCIFCKRL